MVEVLARLARALRRGGAPVSVGDTVDAALAVTLIDLSDRAETRRALRIALKILPEHTELFDRLFDELWSAGHRRRRRDLPARLALGSRHRGDARQRIPLADLRAHADTPAEPEGRPGFSPQRLLRNKPFAEYTEADGRAMRRLLAKLARRLATRTSRRLVSAPRGDQVDMRRTLRRCLRSEGEPMDLAWKRRRIERADVVVLCDTSGSMDPHGRFLLTFLLSLPRVARNAEMFVFNTELHRLTGELTVANVGASLARVAETVPDWSGGTRIGICLDTFCRYYLGRLVSSKTHVVILSDGLDRGDTELLASSSRRIQRRARQVLWLNPLMSDRRYRPTAKGMRAALPHVNRLLPAHDLESLERLIPLLGA